ncbi:unnamed protein product, partial [Laminaria digitata]
MALLLSRTSLWPAPLATSPAFLFQPAPRVGHHHHNNDGPSLQRQGRRRHRFSSSVTNRRIFELRPNSINAVSESPDSVDHHNDAAFGTARVDNHNGSSANIPWGVR